MTGPTIDGMTIDFAKEVLVHMRAHRYVDQICGRNTTFLDERIAVLGFKIQIAEESGSREGDREPS